MVALSPRRDRGDLAPGGDDEELGRGVKVLFVVPRFPAPPWRGDQTRAYHHLRLLAPRHDITCAALVARPPAAAARAEIEAMGVRVEVVRLGPWGAAASLARVLAGDARPLQVLLYAGRRARARVARLAAGADVVHAQLLRTLAYLPAARPPAAVVDLVDALSANFARRADRERGPLGAVVAWEAARLRRAEAGLVRSGVPCLVVSEAERARFDQHATIRVVPNGVDAGAFPYLEDGRPPARLVFGGNLGYFPNVDAASWLAREILPRVRAIVPGAELRLVGARPARAVRVLRAAPGVSLAASVPAMAPELAAATIAVVPLRAGSGLQNKVLEAMAVGTPVVATPRAVAGLDVRPGEHLVVAEDAGALARAIVDLLGDPARARRLARAARSLVERRYRWEDSAAGVEAAWRAAMGAP
jgi:sugar transferase (PEP-CTERM/EpsH1 system associated)